MTSIDALDQSHRTFPKSVQPGIPKLSATKPGWRRLKIGDLFEVATRPCKLNDSDTYRLVTVKRSRGGLEFRGSFRGSQILVKNQFYIECDDFLISKRQIVHGACAPVTPEFSGSIVSNEYVALKCKPIIHLNFLKHLSFSLYFQQTCFHASVGVHVEKMIFNTVSWFKYKIDIPELPEQKKIANFLDAVDERIALLTRKVEALTRHKREVARRLFTRELRFRREDGSDFSDWEEKSLGELAKRVTERNSHFQHTTVLTNSAIHGIVDQQEYFDKDIANQENVDVYYVVRTGDFVYNPRISANAPVGPIKRSFKPIGIMSPLYTVFRFHSQNETFFDQYFASTQWHRYMRTIANYGARHDRMAIMTADFMAMPLPLPHPDEQRRISDFLSALDAKIDTIRSKITAMQTFKKGLLQQMFV